MSFFEKHWGLEFSQEEIAEARAGKGLLSLELELSRACNLRCIYCYASSGLPMENELSLSEILDVVDQAVALGARKIIILGGGEPLLYPYLIDVIDYILSKGVKADLFTSGTLITPSKARALYDRGVAVVVKMNSRRLEIQDFLAGHAGTFQAIEQGIEALRAVGYPDKEHILGVETIICRQNYEELPQLWRWARKQGIIPYVEIMTWQGRAKEHSDLEVPIQKTRTLFETLARIDAEEFGNKWIPHPPLAASHCARHEYSCTVIANGDIHPCPGVSLSAGNVREDTLEHILNKSPVIQELRNIRKLIKGRCGRCELKYRCYGCRGNAYQITGDYLAEDPMCWFGHDD
ncbi:MAG: radical SAM/SPASM domain-containing protein [Thermodesulfobacteriota bacterium]|nr:MAG: radical SAM/SPASM domain-containing protein [Thermodesulfobacteriota bacterium]